MSDVDTTTLARANIQAALRLRNKSSFELSTALGKNRTYLDDFLKGRKASIASMFVERLSRALDIDRGYIVGDAEFDPELPTAISAEEARVARIKKSLHFIQVEINDYENRRSKGQNFDEDDLANAYERRARHNKLLSLAEGRIIDAPAAIVKNENRLPRGFDHGWTVSKAYAKEVLYSISEYITIIKIQDNSMNDGSGNGFASGDRVLADITKRDLRAGGVFAIIFDNEVMVRAIDPTSLAEQRPVVCRALNPLHPPVEIAASDEKGIVGRVVAHIRAL